MADTKIANIIVPEVFNPYVVQRTAELSALVRSGIIQRSEEFDKLAAAGGKLINMPFWADLTGDDEVLSDSGSLTVNNITSGQDVAVLLMRGKAWGVNDLAKALSGDDPMAAIGDLVAEYWVRKQQSALLKMLEGVFGAATMAGNLHDISAAANPADDITASTTVDAFQKVGDAKDLLTGVMMHSATEANLIKQGLITYDQRDVNGVSTRIKRFLDKEVIVDDGCPVANGVYTTYLFGQGAIALGEGAAPVPTETDRDSLAGSDILINRRHFILHPRGVAFQSAAVVGSSPTNAELATAANWARVYDNKNIRVVAFKHHLG
ncbi:MAG: coat protein [Youngiibacter sp.]|nr:coat protein [Youngiibacter sp.]